MGKITVETCEIEGRKDICHGCLPHGAEIVKDGSSLDRFLFYSSLHFFSTPTRIAPLGMA